jgi:hypothetical protein
MYDAPFPTSGAPMLGDSDGFVDLVLRSALTAPGAATDPVAGRVLARLLAVIAVERGDDILAPYLAATPGQPSTFEVRVFRAGDLIPATVTVETGPVAALKTAFRLAREGTAGVEVLSCQTSEAVERCVLVRDATGELEFRFPRAETLVGDPYACATALRVWEATLDEWAAGVSRARDEGPHSGPVPSEGQWSAAPSRATFRLDRGARGDDGRSEAEADALADVIRECFADLTVEVLSRSSSQNGPVLDALEGFFANLTIEVDLGQVEQLVKNAVEMDRQDIVEPIAKRVAGILGPTLVARLSNADLPARPQPVSHPEPVPVIMATPSANEVAEIVSAQVGALLSETILSRRYGDSGGQAAALRAMITAVERLEVQLDGLRDEVRRSSSLLTTFDGRLEANDRRAAVTERLATSVDQEVQRLAHRIDEQVTALAANAGSGSELSDGVARLTRKLRQSVTQLDRALVRLGEVSDLAEAEAVVEDPEAPALPVRLPPPSLEPVRLPRPLGPLNRR